MLSFENGIGDHIWDFERWTKRIVWKELREWMIRMKN
jgi:hypothetical protein